MPVHVLVIPDHGDVGPSESGLFARLSALKRRALSATRLAQYYRVIPCCSAAQLLAGEPARARAAAKTAETCIDGFLVTLPGDLLLKIAPLMAMLFKVLAAVQVVSAFMGAPLPNLPLPAELLSALEGARSGVVAAGAAWQRFLPAHGTLTDVLTRADNVLQRVAPVVGDSDKDLVAFLQRNAAARKGLEVDSAALSAELQRLNAAAAAEAFGPAHAALKSLLQDHSDGKWAAAAVAAGSWRRVVTTAASPLGGGHFRWVYGDNFSAAIDPTVGVATAPGNEQKAEWVAPDPPYQRHQMSGSVGI